MNINGGKENLITTITNLALFCLLVTKSQLIPSKRSYKKFCKILDISLEELMELLETKEN